MAIDKGSMVDREPHQTVKDSPSADATPQDVFGYEANHDIKYKTMSWQIVAFIMFAEIVSNGMLSLPSSLATVGMVPGLILIIFLGAFALYTSIILINFKIRHPEVHNMGDAGYILFGMIGREVFSIGTLIFAVFGTGGQILSGQFALSFLSENRLCPLSFTGIFAAATFLCALPRTFDSLGWLAIPSCLSITLAGLVGMIGAGVRPEEGRTVVAAQSSDFDTAFFSITNPVFAFAGHFMFFTLLSEMKQPRDANKAAYCLQISSTTYYSLFAGITYGFLGGGVASPSFSSLDPIWGKIAYGIALPNLLIAGSLYSHTASKIVFIRIFRHSRHLHEHTIIGWSVWVGLIMIVNVLAFVLATGVPIFNYLIGIAASLFAAWFTYGTAGMFLLHDSYHDGEGSVSWSRNWFQTTLALLTIIGGSFICIAGLYSTIVAIRTAYDNAAITAPFTC